MMAVHAWLNAHQTTMSGMQTAMQTAMEGLQVAQATQQTAMEGLVATVQGLQVSLCEVLDVVHGPDGRQPQVPRGAGKGTKRQGRLEEDRRGGHGEQGSSCRRHQTRHGRGWPRDGPRVQRRRLALIPALLPPPPKKKSGRLAGRT